MVCRTLEPSMGRAEQQLDIAIEFTVGDGLRLVGSHNIPPEESIIGLRSVSRGHLNDTYLRSFHIRIIEEYPEAQVSLHTDPVSPPQLIICPPLIVARICLILPETSLMVAKLVSGMRHITNRLI